ncbi:PTS system cellobiose-specific IIB component [Sporolactobacillus spathodeae]|uniref:PTS system cellobiose-specific IIB component n=2 Tax=Sporolactobacillus spathodeae TaxID=1465502 RepID=A0ABS2Q8T3_9BACL|nr:PTS system cellobiose-specific IIB component [Sporolactobacillus spathodeae]
MMKIVLCCAAGMSTSLLVSKMEAAAKAQGKDYSITAVPAEQVPLEIDNTNVLLLGPQVKYLLKKFQQLGKEKNVPVDVIGAVEYGMMDGAKVLKKAEKLAGV